MNNEPQRFENRRPAVRPLRPREFRRSTNRKIIKWPATKIGGNARVSLRQRNRVPVRTLELLAASEAPELHRLTRDNSRRGRAAVVTRLLLSEAQSRIGCHRFGRQNRTHIHSRYRSRTHRRRIRAVRHSRTLSTSTDTPYRIRMVIPRPSPPTPESRTSRRRRRYE